MYNFCPSQEEQILNTGQSGREQPTNRRRVLQDYRQQGKRFIPPMLQHFPFLKETNWIDERVPELVWIALLLRVYGMRQGMGIAVRVAQATKSHCNRNTGFALTSDYSGLNDGEKEAVRADLGRDNTLDKSILGLAALVKHYKDFPLKFLADSAPGFSTDTSSHLEELKEVLRTLRDRESHFATMVQAVAVRIFFENDMLRVAPHVGLANLRAIDDYPLTEEANRVAASVRSFISGIIASLNDAQWPGTFWERGRELEPCEE